MSYTYTSKVMNEIYKTNRQKKTEAMLTFRDFHVKQFGETID
jgi:hypothetical protein